MTRPISTWRAVARGPFIGQRVANARAVWLTARRHSSTFAAQWSPKPEVGDQVFLAMSGGVDSSVMALLLSQQAASVATRGSIALQPIYMRNWSALEESEEFEPGSGGAAGCEWQQEWESVQAVCSILKLPEPRLLDLSQQYWTSVFAPSLDEWQSGRTPNPDVLCNREVKFGALMDQVIPIDQRETWISPSQGKFWLATGHYAKVFRPTPGDEPQLHRSIDRSKDQSYFLSSVPSAALRHALFPLASMKKSQVRRVAAEFGLPSAERKESMGLCFVGQRGKGQPRGVRKHASFSNEEPPQNSIKSQQSQAQTFGDWLLGYLAPSSPYTLPGPIVSALDGVVLGHHKGLHTLTIGQGARVSGQQQKWFVAAKHLQKPASVQDDGAVEAVALVVPGNDHPLLTCVRVQVPLESFQWVSESGAPAALHKNCDRSESNTRSSEAGVSLSAQVRHRAPETACRVRLLRRHSRSGNGVGVSSVPSCETLSISFDEGHRPNAICPGQVLALYDGQRCLGSGVIPDLPGAVMTLGQKQSGNHDATRSPMISSCDYKRGHLSSA